MGLINRGWHGDDLEFRTLDRLQLRGKRQLGLAEITNFDLMDAVASSVHFGNKPEVSAQLNEAETLRGERYRDQNPTYPNDRDIQLR